MSPVVSVSDDPLLSDLIDLTPAGSIAASTAARSFTIASLRLSRWKLFTSLKNAQRLAKHSFLRRRAQVALYATR